MTLRHHRLYGFALAVAIAGTAVPSASARPLEDRPVAPQVRVSTEPGFDWGDARIGAAAAFVATMLGIGGTVVLRSRHAS